VRRECPPCEQHDTPATRRAAGVPGVVAGADRCQGCHVAEVAVQRNSGRRAVSAHRGAEPDQWWGPDDGEMWPVTFAIVDWTDAVAARVEELVRAAVS
jgi:hypothetical protein